MITKQQHIQHWIDTAEEDWVTVDVLMKQKRYLHCLFWSHLVIEKLAKALWIKNNVENVPPKTHNIPWLLEQANVDLGDETIVFLRDFNKYQLSTRYPEYIENLYKTCTKSVTEHKLEIVKDIRTCLLKMLP